MNDLLRCPVGILFGTTNGDIKKNATLLFLDCKEYIDKPSLNSNFGSVYVVHTNMLVLNEDTLAWIFAIAYSTFKNKKQLVISSYTDSLSICITLIISHIFSVETSLPQLLFKSVPNNIIQFGYNVAIDLGLWEKTSEL